MPAPDSVANGADVVCRATSLALFPALA